MIDRIADRLAWKIKSMNEEETASVELLSYFFAFVITNLSVVIISLSFSMLWNTLTETILAMTGFAILRAVSGGYHIQSADLCVVLSTAMMISIPLIPLSLNLTITLTFLSLLLVAVYAPANIKKQTNIPESFHKYLKFISIVITASNFWFMSSVLALAFFIQSMLLIPFTNWGR